MKAGVYSITHVATDRHYVGSSRDVHQRFKAHRSMLRLDRHHSIHLQRAWNTYGEDQFAFVVLESVGDVDALLEREQEWMNKLGACDPRGGFNVAPVSGTRAGIPHSAESRALMSAKAKGRPKSAEHRAKIGAGNRGKVRSEETKRLIAAAVMEAMKDPARKLASASGGRITGGWNKGLSPSDQVRARMSASAKKRMALKVRDGNGRFV